MKFSELESNGEEAVLAYFNVPYLFSPEGIEKVHNMPRIMKSYMFWGITPCSPFQVRVIFQQSTRLYIP
jgi:hypothetical protein